MLRGYQSIRTSAFYGSRRLCNSSSVHPPQVNKSTVDQLEELAPPGWRISKIWSKPKSLTTRDKLKVIFTADTATGQKGEILWVTKGLARNYYFPRNEAVFATTSNLAKYKDLIENVDHEEIKRKKRLQKYKKRINKIVVAIKRHENVNGGPHAPCFKKTIVDYLWKNHSIELDESQILLEKPIENWGEYLVPIDLGVGEILKLDVIFSSFKTKTKTTDDNLPKE